MKRLHFFLLFVISGCILLTSLSGESLLKRFEGSWSIMNSNSAVINNNFIAIGEYKGYKTASICFIKKVVKTKNHFVITCNSKPPKAARENAKKILKDEGQPWDEMNDKDIIKTSIKLFPTESGFKLSEDGREYNKM